MSVAGEVNPTPPASAIVYPKATVAWGMVIMLTVAYVFSFVDRYILGLLVQPIKADLGLSDTEIGLLLGPAFAIFYATMGLPLGWLADRRRRTWIVGVGVALWSLATAASGLARNFTQMFIARMSVGVGEATLSPSAMSMIADSFPNERRGKPIAVYTAALGLGSGIASLIGAAVLTWTKTAPETILPLIGAVKPWQLTFFIVGLPGLVLAGVFIGMKEPPRQSIAQTDPALSGSGLWAMLSYVGGRWATFASFISLVCVMTIMAYSHGWMPAAFERTWGWPAEQYAAVNAIITLAVAPATTYAAGSLSDAWTKAGRRDAPLRLLMIGSVIMVPTGAVAMLMPSPVWAWVILAFNIVGIASVSAVSVTALLNLTPAQIRAQVVALYYMVISLTGLLLGPTTVGLLSDYVFGEENLRYAISTLPVIFGVIPLAIIPITRRLYLEQMDRLEGKTNE